MNNQISKLQEFINFNINGNIVVDGIFGNESKLAVIKLFSNKNPALITEDQLLTISRNLGDINSKRLKAIAKVESSGFGWKKDNKLKILFERHIFYKLTTGSKDITNYCNPKAGGYNESNWEKFLAAIKTDPVAAFQSISMGEFQILGKWWDELGYGSPYTMALDLNKSQYAQYVCLVNFIKNVANGVDEFLKISENPKDNIPFAKIYNGSGYDKNNYHIKLAEAMK